MSAIFSSVFVLSVQAGHKDKINTGAHDSIVVNETSGNYIRGWGMGGVTKMLTAKMLYNDSHSTRAAQSTSLEVLLARSPSGCH